MSNLAWGNKVDACFRAKLFEVCLDLGWSKVEQASNLMACMAFESGESFSPSVKNAAGSGATGLIQFMPATARSLGTTTAALAALSATDQLEWVKKYFWPYRNKVQTIQDMYMAILWPAAVGRPNSYVLFNKTAKPTAYRQNAGLDFNKDGNITKEEASDKVVAKLKKGLQSPYVYAL